MRCNMCGWDNPNDIARCQKCGNRMNGNVGGRQMNHQPKDRGVSHLRYSVNEDSDSKESATVFLILAGVFSLLGGFLGSIIGFTVFYSRYAVIDPETRMVVKLKTYKESHRKAGLVIGIFGIISWIIWIIIVN